MGFDLCGRGGLHAENWSAWVSLLDLARRYGWKPAGTVMNQDVVGWNGSYLSNNYQEVTDTDAKALGEALMRAVHDLANQRGVSVADIPEFNRERQFEALLLKLRAGAEIVLPEEQDAPDLSHVMAFARYALKGGFRIG